ncbi:uncharacterized protein B0I36DRAFT_361800 [Microdochium trichocladiopsis]|uniref:Ribosomal protein bL31m N-terminal domain-containing protein n=1 Tax=Microdochium trichocladiopsis TaxID=1682393 RepID=A0A9P8YBD3_9PEZI|nr:uncharacterized protein B0I36DRAFT_361800 [Microdochium trichocladiopsis]KAH7033082.1 hypothetical protein B0I36DRAFT_361800 [Microdochium trichocladiopsis]
MSVRVPASVSAFHSYRPALPSSSTCRCASITTRSAVRSSAWPAAPSCGRRAFSQTSARAADIIRRPRRPYQFTQLVQLSDGSTYTMRTSSPLAMYKSTKDTRNHLTWQPSDRSLKSVEVDEAGKLAAFRERFGRAFDLEVEQEEDQQQQQGSGTGANTGSSKTVKQASNSDGLGDLIAGYARPEDTPANTVDRNKKPVGKKK